MNAPDQSTAATPPSEPAADASAQLAALRAQGAARFDPARMHYLEALATRAAAHQGPVKRLLDARLAQGLAVFFERFALARQDATAIIEHSLAQNPHAAKDLQELHAAGDFKELRRRAASINVSEQHTALRTLVRQLEQHTPEHIAEHPTPTQIQASSRPELKAIRNFRNTWSRLSVDRQLAQALEQAPTTAGPINSHMLVLRSLALMRDVAPDYLNRFMSYVDTLLCLDQGGREKRDKEKQVAPKKQGTRAGRLPKAG